MKPPCASREIIIRYFLKRDQIKKENVSLSRKEKKVDMASSVSASNFWHINPDALNLNSCSSTLAPSG